MGLESVGILELTGILVLAHGSILAVGWGLYRQAERLCLWQRQRQHTEGA